MRAIIKNILPYFILKYLQRKNVRMNVFYKKFQEKAGKLANKRFVCLKEDIIPCFDEQTATTAFDHHYVYHTAWAA